ncbi:MAG: hypothetical protein VKI82_08530 [Leptolyngbya sp.]|nr:hypothetical protein [Leptolyngbya sp.]
MTLFPSLALNLGTIAGTALWALSLYLGFSPVADRVIDGCQRWLQSLRPEATSLNPSSASDQEAHMATASLLSVLPFLALGGVAHYGLSLSLGGSWAVSLGLIAFMISGVYELGRQSGQAD